MKAMKVARRTFTYMDTDGPGEVEAGERIVADHALVRDFPDEFRDFGLDDELAVRSAWVAEMRREEAERHTASPEPVSRAGREERKQEDFWRSVDQQLHREEYTSAERAEQAVYDDGLAQLERLEAARMRGELEEIQGMYYGRLAD